MNHSRVIYRGPGKGSRQTRSTKLQMSHRFTVAYLASFTVHNARLINMTWLCLTYHEICKIISSVFNLITVYRSQGVNVISPSAKFYWINIQSIKKIHNLSIQFNQSELRDKKEMSIFAFSTRV